MSPPLATLVTAPRQFFSTARDDPDSLPPIVVVAATGAITFGAQLLLVSMSVIGDRPTLSYVSAAIRVELPAITVAGSLVSFGHVFAYWVAFAAVFYLVSRPFADRGSFATVFWLTGWGFTPWLLTGVVWLAAMIASAYMTPAPTTPAENDVFVQQVQQTSLVRASRYLDHLGTLWSLGLWVAMVRVVRGVSRRNALVAVSPVAAFELAKVVLL
jgi:hypothetical protein